MCYIFRDIFVLINDGLTPKVLLCWRNDTLQYSCLFMPIRVDWLTWKPMEWHFHWWEKDKYGLLLYPTVGPYFTVHTQFLGFHLTWGVELHGAQWDAEGGGEAGSSVFSFAMQPATPFEIIPHRLVNLWYQCRRKVWFRSGRSSPKSCFSPAFQSGKGQP